MAYISKPLVKKFRTF